MKVFDAFINAFKVPQLRQKLLFTMAMLIVFRLGAFVPLPGIDPEQLKKYFDELETHPIGPLVALVDAFSGSALRQLSVFALGIMPYITMSIIFSLLVNVIPALERMAKEGRAGQRKIHQYTRYATVALCMFQGTMMLKLLQRDPESAAFFTRADPAYLFFCALLLTTGSIFLMWLGELIDEYGIGSGVSLLIMGGIVSRMPTAVAEVASQFRIVPAGPSEIGIGRLIVIAGLFVGVVMGVVLITQGQRRIPFQQASQVRGMRRTQGLRNYMPLRVNYAGVIPIVFAQSLLMLPAFLAGAIGLPAVARLFTYEGGFAYNVMYIVLIFFFTFFYTAIIFNPLNVADDLRRWGSFIPGIRPGRRTAEYLEHVMTRVTLGGAAFLAVIAVLPAVVAGGLRLSTNIYFVSFYGGTGILIVVGVVLDLVQRVETQLVARHYEGFLGRRRVRGRVR